MLKVHSAPPQRTLRLCVEPPIPLSGESLIPLTARPSTLYTLGLAAGMVVGTGASISSLLYNL